jgi:hypothetical protein
MKRQKIDIKKRIKKRIEFRHSKFIHINKHQEIKHEINDKMNEKTKLRVFADIKKPVVGVDLILSNEATQYTANYAKTSTYIKKEQVDFDVVICIPSFDRYKKVKRLILQFYEQPTKYKFKIVLLNDGSSNVWYNKLPEMFPEIIYLKNDVPNGKALHWYCYNQMWDYIKNIQCHAVLQMDDDFILSDNFLDTIVDLFFQKKIENDKIMAISPHKWSFKQHVDFENWWYRKDFVDGIALIDDVVIRIMDYKMKPVNIAEVSKPGTPVRAWSQISEAIKKMGGIIFRTEFSLVYHDGNDDSKLHGDVRKEGKKGVYTQKYIGKL